MGQATLDRQMLRISRTREYCELEELEKMVGLPLRRFAEVPIKELADNGLDACEQAGVDPKIRINVRHGERHTRIWVWDGGPGIPPEVGRNDARLFLAHQ